MYSPITGTGDGTAPVVNISFDYIDKAHVKGAVDGVEVGITWTGASQITFDAAVTSGHTWTVFRQTPISLPLVDFTNGSVLTEQDLDMALAQLRYHEEEIESRVPLLGDTGAIKPAATRDAMALRTETSLPVLLSEAGRAGVFIFDGSNLSASVTADPEQGLYVPPTGETGSAGAWVRQFDGPISVRWFGAKGDGTTDDRAAIQAALDYADSIGGSEVLFPVVVPHVITKYLVSGYLSVGPKTTLRGLGNRATVITSAHTGGGGANAGESLRNGSIFHSLHASNSSSTAGITIEDLGFENTNAANVGAAFYDNGGTFIHINRIRVVGFKFGAVLDQSELVDIDLSIFEMQNAGGGGVWFVNGADLTPGNLPSFTNRTSIKRSQFNQSPTAYGIIDDGGYLHVYEDNNYNGALNHIRAAGVEGLSIRGGEWEGSAEEPVYLGTTSLAGGGVGANTGIAFYGGLYTPPVTHSGIYVVAGVVDVGGGIQIASTEPGITGVPGAVAIRLSGWAKGTGSGPLIDPAIDVDRTGLITSPGAYNSGAGSNAAFRIVQDGGMMVFAASTGLGYIQTFGGPLRLNWAGNDVLFGAGATALGTIAAPDMTVNMDAYGPSWNGSSEVPTKNDVYDKIESLTLASWDFNPPPASDFTLFSGDGTAATKSDDTDIGLAITTSAAANTGVDRGAYKALPAGDFTLTVKYALDADNLNLQGGGIVMYESATGKSYTVVSFGDPTPYQLRKQTIAGGGPISSINFASYHLHANEIWLRFKRVGTTLTVEYSYTGKKWFTILSESQTTYFTTAPDRIGPGVYLFHPSAIPTVYVRYWEQSW